jgi:hypothetical protein
MCNGGNLAQSFLRLSPPDSGMDPSILAQSSHFNLFHLLLLPFDLKARPLVHTPPNEKQEVPYQNFAIAFVLQLLVVEEEEDDDHPQERFDEEDNDD